MEVKVSQYFIDKHSILSENIVLLRQFLKYFAQSRCRGGSNSNIIFYCVYTFLFQKA